MAHWRADDRPDTTMSSEQDSQEAQFDSANLYREDSFTDLRTGSIRRLTPVTADGEPDDSRPVIYQGQAAMMTPAGQLPLNFEIEADSLAAAADAFADQVQEEARRVIEELRDLQRKQELSSPILQPGDPRMGGMGGGGMGGGGKIQL